LVPVAKARPPVVDLVSPAAVAPCRHCRLAELACLATPEKRERVSVMKDTP
jgi:hypothetical protein